MLSILLFTLNSIMPVILLMVLGYILKSVGFFTKEFLSLGNKTVFYVCLPVLLFKNIADIEDLSEIRIDVVIYAVVITGLIFFFGMLAAGLIEDPLQKGVIHQCVFRSNYALIGVPLSELMGGANGVRIAAVLSLFTIPLFNTLAVIVLSVYREGNVKVDVGNIIRTIFRNPLIRGVLLGLVFAFLKNTMYEHAVTNPFAGITFLDTAISYLACSATPLALLILGGRLDMQKLSGYKKPLLLGIAGRNFLAPLIGVGLAAILTLKGVTAFGSDVFSALIALFGTPVAVASAIMAEAMDNDGQLAGQLVVWTTILSMFSLFIIIFIIRALGLL